MIEKTVLDYLSNVMDCPVRMEIDNTLSGKYVIIEKTGGYVQNMIKHSTIAVQSYADSLYDAALLNESVMNYMEHIITVPSVSKCSVNSNYNFTNTETKKYRYQAVFDIVHF